MAVLVYKHNKYALEIDRSKGRFYIDDKLMFKGLLILQLKYTYLMYLSINTNLKNN